MVEEKNRKKEKKEEIKREKAEWKLESGINHNGENPVEDLVQIVYSFENYTSK
jgi:hypothetical protein